LRALEGPAAHGFNEAAREAFWKGPFTVSTQSDRMGVRLRGGTIQAPGGGRMASEGMAWGAVQAPPSGEPIILGVDHPTTGGYPVIACVATVDLPALGQARPEQPLSFERVSLEEAHRLLRERERRLDEELPQR
jgi:allophanate hydrolase subunit 2